MAKRKLGEVLARRGQISDESLSKAILEQRAKLVHLGEILYESSTVEKDALVAAISEVTGVEYVDCTSVRPDPAALALLPAKLAEQFSVLPLRFEGRKLVIVMAEPQDLATINHIAFSAGCQIAPRFGFKAEITKAIFRHYEMATPFVPGLPELETPRAPADGIEFFSNSKRVSNVEAMRELQAELLHRTTPAVQEASLIITEAIRIGASDIHIEPLAGETIV